MKKTTTTLKKYSFLLLVILFSSILAPIQAQINAGPDQTICFPNCANLSATVTPQAGTTSYTVSNIGYAPDPFNAGTSVSLSDDQWSSVINIGFTFCFYGNSYTQLLIGSNNLLSFALGGAGGNCQWPINAAVPTASNPMNTVMGPWQDINPGVGGTIKYASYGAAPNRRFVVSYSAVPMFSCVGILYSSQIVLFETTNIIETHILDKQICAGWNGGNAIHALHNSNGTLASVNGTRNWPNQWAASNEGTRWTPSGASAYTVAWLDPSNNVISNTVNVTVCPNTTTTYTAVVTYSCPVQVFTDAVIVNVVNPPAPTISANGPLSFCQGGSVILTSSSATGNVWSTGATTQSITVTTSGSYTVTVTDVNGCVGTSAATVVTVYPNPTVTITPVHVLCNGANNGTATANPAGGTAPYTYLWSNGQTTQTISGLAPGVYSVTVTDANGCVGTASVTITQPTALTATFTQVNVLCFGQSTGTATANPAGGTPSYTYLWSNGQTTQTATGLAAGVHTCTVRDVNGCTVVITVTITQPASAVSATTTQVNVLCFGQSTGTATANPAGGTSPYTYLWSNGQTTQTATGLAAGVHTCTVRDANGCTVIVTVTITQPASAVSATSTQVNVLCNGQSTGTATANPAGGTSPYTYLWSNGQTTQTATGLAAGVHTCTVTDANGCAVTITVTITQPTLLTNTTTQVNVLCNGQATGSATVNPAGGTPTYTYLWSNGATTQTINGLVAGTYTCVVTDANGCTSNASVTITQASNLTATYTQVNVLCFGQSTGTATANPAGGTPGYTYLWSNGQTTQTATGLAAGVHSCTVTDANGCTVVITVTITQPASAVSATTTQVNVLCFGQSTGTGTANPAGGTSPYTYLWSNGQTSQTSTGLAAGVHTCTVTDANGCTVVVTVTITQPASAVSATSTQVNVLCNGQSTGTATANPAGGTSPYTYLWSNGQTTQTATGFAAGVHTCTVTDANGCTVTITVTITQPTLLTNTTTQVNVLCNGQATGNATVNPAGGTPTYTYLWSNGATIQTINGLVAGTYTCVATDANGCTTNASVTVTEPATAVSATSTQLNVLCFGNATGTATANPAGGTPGYTYLWSNGQTTQTATGLVAATYTCTVTDANGCPVSISVTIIEPTILTASITQVDVLCFGNSTGTATANPIGGTSPYTYLWSDGQTTQTATGLLAGNYTCNVTDANGCSVIVNVTINQPAAALTTTTNQTNILCFGQATGDATVNPLGGTSPYTYLWINGGTTQTISGLIAGTYTVVVTDANGCTSNASVTLTQPPAITFTTSQVDELCNGGNNGSATVSPFGGGAPFTYLWSDGQTTQTAIALVAGTYTCVITDVNGCTITATVTIIEPALLAILPINPVTICIGQSTTLISTATGGTPPYAFVWSPSGPLVNPVVTTVYSVTATDANGCTSAPQTVTVTVNPPLAMLITKSDSICPGQTIAITAAASGGDGGPYNYQWTWAGGTSTFASINVTPSVTTTYYVTATDNCGTPSVSDSVTITVNPVAVIVMNADKLNGCSPLCVNFTDASTIATGSIVSRTWDFGDGTALSTSQNPSHCYSLPGSYNVTLTATSNLGCTSSSTINAMITVYADPISQFTFGPQPTTVLDPLISFSNLSTNARSYLWDFGDKNDDAISTLANPQHLYSDTGIYCVKLVAESQYGCKDSVTNCLVIDPQFTLFIPNAFSPNGDGENDFFAPKGQFILEFEMIIYDRWGNLLFRTNSISNGWNGVANNGDKVAQQDVYVYLIKVLDLKGNKRTYNGTVTIVK